MEEKYMCHPEENRQPTAITDPNDDNWQYIFDANNMLGHITRFTCDKSGNRTIATDANNNNTHYEYNQDKLVKEIDPLGNVISYSYDANGHLATRTDACGNIVTYNYNANGRLLKKSYPDGTEETFTYDVEGNLLTAANKDISYAFTYDTTGRMLNSADSNGKTIHYAYDSAGNKIRVTYPDGSIINYTYDNANRLKIISTPVGSFTYEYDNLGRRITLDYPNSTAASYSYDANGRLSNLTHQNLHGQTIASFAYAHDTFGNRLTKSEPHKQTTYTYDNNHQLLKAEPNGQQYPEQYSYDMVGNRLTGPELHSSFSYGAGNQLLSTNKASYSYDKNGNLVEKSTKHHQQGEQTWCYSYDYDNRLIQAETKHDHETTTITFKYDPFGRRIEKKINTRGNQENHVNTISYIYDGQSIIMEEKHHGGHTGTIRYIHGPNIDEPLAICKNDQNYFYHTDGLGSITALSNRSGAIVQKYEYDSFGNMLRTSDLSQPYCFTGREFDLETGLHYCRARYYDPQIGRFIQRDPISFAGGDWNLYGYVQNNPVNWGDPSGLEREWAEELGDTPSVGQSEKGVYVLLDSQNNTLTVVDLATKKDITDVPAFTGGHVDEKGNIVKPGTPPEIPASPGLYYITNNPAYRDDHPDWFGLLKCDDSIDDYFDGGRSGVRLHEGRVSHGCVTVVKGTKWASVFAMIRNTKTSEIKYRRGPHWWNEKGEITTYGTLEIQ